MHESIYENNLNTPTLLEYEMFPQNLAIIKYNESIKYGWDKKFLQNNSNETH